MNHSIIKELSNYQSKKINMITILIPANFNFVKQLKSTIKKMYSIKNRYKAHLICDILRNVLEQMENSNKDRIICCGKIQSMICLEYESPNKIEEYEYYYDSQFNIQRITEIVYSHIISIGGEEDVGEVNKLIKTNSIMIKFDDEIDEPLGDGRVGVIYSNIINLDMLEKLNKYNTKFVKLELPVGNYIGVLRY
jgi:hypothetical protein